MLHEKALQRKSALAARTAAHISVQPAEIICCWTVSKLRAHWDSKEHDILRLVSGRLSHSRLQHSEYLEKSGPCINARNASAPGASPFGAAFAHVPKHSRAAFIRYIVQLTLTVLGLSHTTHEVHLLATVPLRPATMNSTHVKDVNTCYCSRSKQRLISPACKRTCVITTMEMQMLQMFCCDPTMASCVSACATRGSTENHLYFYRCCNACRRRVIWTIKHEQRSARLLHKEVLSASEPDLQIKPLQRFHGGGCAAADDALGV